MDACRTKTFQESGNFWKNFVCFLNFFYRAKIRVPTLTSFYFSNESIFYFLFVQFCLSVFNYFLNVSWVMIALIIIIFSMCKTQNIKKHVASFIIGWDSWCLTTCDIWLVMFDGIWVYCPRTVRHFTSLALGLDRATSLDHAPRIHFGIRFLSKCTSYLDSNVQGYLGVNPAALWKIFGWKQDSQEFYSMQYSNYDTLHFALLNPFFCVLLLLPTPFLTSSYFSFIVLRALLHLKNITFEW